MKRLTDESGICVDCDSIAYCNTDCFNKKIYDRLKYYEDLEEQRMRDTNCYGCLHLWDKRYDCKSCARFGHVDHYVSNN